MVWISKNIRVGLKFSDKVALEDFSLFSEN